MGVLAPGSAHARPSAQPPTLIKEHFFSNCLYKLGQRSFHLLFLIQTFADAQQLPHPKCQPKDFELENDSFT